MASIRWDKKSAEYIIPPEVKKFGLPMAERMRKDANRARFDIELAIAKKRSPQARAEAEANIEKMFAASNKKARDYYFKLGLFPSARLTQRRKAEERYLSGISSHDPHVLAAHGSVRSFLAPDTLPRDIYEDEVQERLNEGYVQDFGEGWGRYSKMTDEEIAEAYEKAPRAERYKWKTHAFRRALAIHDLIYENQQADQNLRASLYGLEQGTKDTVAAVASNIPIVRDVAELGAHLTGSGSPRARYIRNRTKDLDKYLEGLPDDQLAELQENWHLIAPERSLTWDERSQREDLILKHPTMPLYGFIEDTWQPVMTIFDIYGGVGAAKQLMKMGAAGAKKLAALRAGSGAARVPLTAKEAARLVGQGAIVGGSAALTAYDASWLKDDIKRLRTEPYAGAGVPHLEDYNLSQKELSQALQDLRDLGYGGDEIKQFVRKVYSEAE